MTKKEFWEKAYLAALVSPALATLAVNDYGKAERMSMAAKSVAKEAVADLERNWGDSHGKIHEDEGGPYR